MTSVMPAWKQALIEKKRKREQEEKAKIQVEEDRTASLPEWKKTLLARKKGLSLHGADRNGLDEQANIANNNVSGYDKPGQKRNSFTSSSTERQLESNLSKSPPTVIIIPKARSQSGSQGRQHSFVASSASQPDQQENKQINQKLSRNGQEKIINQEIVPKDEENNSKVSYEHIKTPSELRKLFGLASRDSVSFGSTSTESKKIQNQQTPAHRDVSTKPQRSSSTRDYEQSQKPSVNTHPQTYSRQSMRETEVELHKSHTPAKNEENNAIIIPKDNDTAISAHSEHDNRTQIVKDDEIPADLHVKVIRTKFGPSGNFRLQKSSSSDNLLNSKQPVSPRGRPPPLNKRWSADVSGILSPTRSTSEDEDTYDLLHNDNHGKRMRSKSMGDVRIPLDHQYHDIEPVVNFKHRVSVSSGIERRLQVLLHNLSAADGIQDDYAEVGNVENMDMHLDQNSPAKDHLQDDYRKNTISGGSSGKQIDEDDLPPKIRKASWYNPEENSKDTRFIFTEQDYDLNKKPAVESTSSLSSGHDFHKSSVAQEKIEAKHYDFGRIEVATDKGKPIPNLKSGVQFKESVPQKTISMNGKISHESEDDELDIDEKPPKGSVHKLSSIFGASISKSNKKAKTKTNNLDVTSKTSQERQINQENMSKTEKKNSQKRIFPWSKKPKKSELVKEVKEEQNKHFGGASSLKPVHQEVVEQKIAGNMTLVINSSAGSHEPKSRQKPPKLNLANQAPASYSNRLSDQNSQVKVKNEKKLSLGVGKPEEMMVTVIDVPSPSSPNDVEVSAIDMPETPSPTPVSVIDIPESPDHDVKVSVIDMPPDDEGDSDDSDSSSSGMSGSYDINPAMDSIGEEEEEEEEEDIDNVPVSYVGDSTYMKVPEVIFESKVENVKSCMSSPLRSRKRKAKVEFNTSNLVKVHDYPSEACMMYHYDQYSKENGGKTLDQYRPASLQGFELNIREREKEKEEIKDKKDKSITKHKVLESTDNTERSAAPTITYLDEGEAFTSSSSSSALLF